MSEAPEKLRDLVAQVASAYFSNSHVAAAEISTVIAQIASSLDGVGTVAASGEGQENVDLPKKLTPAQVKKSITPSALISFEDGRPYKTLRRHLSVRGLTPDDYRQKWGLPASYPMVAPDYSAARSAMAKTLGLGQLRAKTA